MQQVGDTGSADKEGARINEIAENPTIPARLPAILSV
jgi:hypothetical protein